MNMGRKGARKQHSGEGGHEIRFIRLEALTGNMSYALNIKLVDAMLG